MADTEQEGVSPATAGGASPAEQFGAAIGGLAQVVAEGLAFMTERMRDDPDPRDVEIERLREELRAEDPRDGERVELLVELSRIRAKLTVELNHKPSEAARMSVDQLVDELVNRKHAATKALTDVTRTKNAWEARHGQLIGDALAIQQHLQRAVGRAAAELADDFQGRDFGRAMVDRLRIDKERADTEVARLKRLVGESVGVEWNDVPRDEVVRRFLLLDQHWKKACEQEAEMRAELDGLPKQYGDLVNRILEVYDTPARVGVATFDQLAGELNDLIENRKVELYELNKARRRRTEVEAERDRLRAELDGIRPRVRELANALGIATSEPGAFEQWIAKQDKAEPRRWTAVDPEPEIGSVVRAQDDQRRQWTRRRHGWHPDHDCSDRTGGCGGILPAWNELPRPLVEVVDTDVR